MALYLGCWNEAHEVAQDVTSREGSYWHAISHRIEPDSYNSGYWFRKVGEHPVFPSLHSESATILEQHPGTGWKLKKAWDPFLFIEWCEQARQEAGSVKEQAALAIQMAEWRLLFEWCCGAHPPLLR